MVFNLRKRTNGKLPCAEIAEISNFVLVTITNNGLNPYKVVETFTKYCPNIPVQFQLDELYAEPSAEVWAKVKKEMIDRSEFRAQLKSFTYKEQIESLAVYDGEGNAYGSGWVLLALILISSEIFTPKSSDFVGSQRL